MKFNTFKLSKGAANPFSPSNEYPQAQEVEQAYFNKADGHEYQS